MNPSKIYLYAIHDPWFHGLADGDVDDRAAFCAYDRYLRTHPEQRIVVYVGNRYEETIKHYGHFQIEFKDSLNLDEVKEANKVLICAPIHDAGLRNSLASLLESKQNGYCQGCKIGCMNFPNANFMPLLESIPTTHRFSTVDTMISFPMSFVQTLDPVHFQDYQNYGFMKLISPGSIASIPGLLYRLYCPELGGGPGTNMLAIQRHLQTYFHCLPDLPIDKDHFIQFNRTLIEQLGIYTPYTIRQMPVLEENPALRDAMTVMVYFANLIYEIKGSSDMLYHDETPLYSLNNLPPGSILCPSDKMESPPLYDLIASHAVLYDHLPNQEEVLSFYT
jgi:hypothetical protein